MPNVRIADVAGGQAFPHGPGGGGHLRGIAAGPHSRDAGVKDHRSVRERPDAFHAGT